VFRGGERARNETVEGSLPLSHVGGEHLYQSVNDKMTNIHRPFHNGGTERSRQREKEPLPGRGGEPPQVGGMKHQEVRSSLSPPRGGLGKAVD